MLKNNFKINGCSDCTDCSFRNGGFCELHQTAISKVDELLKEEELKNSHNDVDNKDNLPILEGDPKHAINDFNCSSDNKR